MPALKNIKYEKFCQLIAGGESAYSAYEMAGFKKHKDNGRRLRDKKEVDDRIKELQAIISEKLLSKTISDKNCRIAALNDRWMKLQQVIDERAYDPDFKDVPGGSTGLLCHDKKGVGAGPAAEVVDVYEVDTGLLKEMREHEKQAAIEAGQWVEKGDLTTGGEKIAGIRVIEVGK
jgi:hypothetical protein